MIQVKLPYKKLSKKSSKKSAKSDKKVKESSFMKAFRLREEKESNEKIEQQKAIIAAKKEEERKHKIIMKYMIKLDKKLKETVGEGFFVWVDEPGFKKFNMDIDKLRKVLKKDVKKYAGKHLAYFYIKSFHDIRDEDHLLIDKDTWIKAQCYVYIIGEDGTLNKRYSIGGGDFVWTTNDFKITKPTFKFLEFLMHIFDKGLYHFTTLGGVTLDFIIDDLKEQGVEFGDVLQPLAGV